jgi:DNA repair protein RecN (Recombination protein N)
VLVRLKIENLALVGTAEIELGAGLVVISGETGAGKSVLVDSLAILVGERASDDVVRAGGETAVVEGLFRVAPAAAEAVRAVLGEPAEEVALRREIVRGGRNRCYVAGRLAPAALLRELGEVLVELHGQHEHQRLLRRSAQRDLLDAWGGLEPDRRALGAAFHAWRGASGRLEELRAREAERAARVRALADEVREIAAAQIRPEAEEALRAEAERLRSVEDRLAAAAAALDALGEGEVSALERLRAAEAALRPLAREEPLLAGADGRLAAAREEVDDLVRELARYAEALSRDPERLAELDGREEQLLRLQRRYRTDLRGLLERHAAARAELSALESEVVEAEGLGAEVAAAGDRVRATARTLGEGRRRAAAGLADAVRGHLSDLGLGAGTFEARLEPVEEPGPEGGERVELLIAPNAGEPAAPLRAIASGGELSRISLAIKAALADADRVPTLVFDEVDQGIGGRVARALAAKLAAIARGRQVIAVTHLAPIAAAADLHLRVEKVVSDGRSRIEVRRVAGDDRVLELSRMLGGDPESETSRRHARELLEAMAASRRPDPGPPAGAPSRAAPRRAPASAASSPPPDGSATPSGRRPAAGGRSSRP